jgi:hypothetical protein
MAKNIDPDIKPFKQYIVFFQLRSYDGAMTLSAMTFSIVTSMKGLFATLSIMTFSKITISKTTLCHYAECHYV